MDFKSTFTYYFLGIGGIGMSNLARYFLSKQIRVAGYDRTPSDITDALQHEGAQITFTDSVDTIPPACTDRNRTFIIYTPAIPADSPQLTWFRSHNFVIQKRAELLGAFTRSTKALCCAGTHGKTTTSSMLAHILHASHLGCNAFLGGILKNCHSNLLLSPHSEFTVVEADEYDRSFHHLNPFMALITAVDPDHLDIYHTPQEYREAFEIFTSLINRGGALVMKHGLPITPRCTTDDICRQRIERIRDGKSLKTRLLQQFYKPVKIFTYSVDEGDFRAENVKIDNGEIFFDFVTPTSRVKNIQLGVPLPVNIENAVGAMALAHLAGATDKELATGIATFQGVVRRFDFHIKSPKVVYIDDYAHHPQELEACIRSVRQLYPARKITGIFQPHLYSRTRDFAPQFAKALSLLDELILLPIYPARELPIKRVSSEMIFKKVRCPKTLCTKEELIPLLREKLPLDVLLTLGAGDIDRLVAPIENLLRESM